MAKMRLGDLLVRAGLITESDLRVVLAQQKQHGGRLGDHLVRVNLVSEEQIARALAQQLGLTYNDLTKAIPAAISALLPEKVAARLQALAVAFDPRTQTLSVAFSDPLDEAAINEVARVTGKQVVAQVTQAANLRRAIEHAYFGVEVRDEGTSEFQLVDIHGRGKTVKVHSSGSSTTKEPDDEELPVLGTSEMEPLPDESGEVAADEDSDEHVSLGQAPLTLEPSQPARTPMRIAPPAMPVAVRPPPPRAAPQAPAAATDSGAGNEALRTVWALAEILIERGYFTRADLMKGLRGK